MERWTPEEDRIIAEGYEQGLKSPEIAAMLPGRSRHAVYNRAANEGLLVDDENPRSINVNALKGSTKLRVATLAMFERMPARVVREILCPQAKAEAGSEPAPFKTASIERLAA